MLGVDLDKGYGTFENCYLQEILKLFSALMLVPLAVLIYKQIRRKKYAIDATKALRFWIYIIMFTLDLSLALGFFNIRSSHFSSLRWIVGLL
jgi:hypothetical protein